MTEQFCEHTQVVLLQLVESQKTALFSLCVLHFVFSPVATLGNALAIRALWKASSLPANLRKLLLSLAFSDLAVGLFAHTTYAVVLVMLGTLNNLDVRCALILTLSLSMLLSVASLLNVTAIAVDRLLAVSLHLRYAELVTSKRVTITLVAIWLTSCLSSLVPLIKLNYSVVAVIVTSIGFLSTTFAYVRVYRVARYHQNQIQAQCQQQAMVLLCERKSALNVMYIYIVFVACYLPHFCLAFHYVIHANNFSVVSSITFMFAFFFVLLNSSLNPLIYCWRYREVRQIMKDTLKKIFHT